MISIITGVHNQLAMNRLFYEHLAANTVHPFQLIVIDNASDDGSGDYFRAQGADVIRNDVNYSYPYTQNQGIPLATHDLLFFLNNDVVVSKGWDTRAVELMLTHHLDVASCAGTNRLRHKRATRIHLKRWLAIKHLLMVFGPRYQVLKLMHWLFFFGDFDGYCRRHRDRYFDQVVEGIAGFNILMTRHGLGKVGWWDPCVKGSDFDVFLRTKQRSLQHGDVKPIHLLCDIYLHHFQRITFRSDFMPFADQETYRPLTERWEKETVRRLMLESDRIYFQSDRSSADF